MAKLDKIITVPHIDGRRFTCLQAAALCALSRFGRIYKDSQFRAWVWWTQRYLAAWLTPRRFFDRSRQYGAAFCAMARDDLGREGLLTIECECAGLSPFFCTPQGNGLAAKLRAAMPEALSESEFANERARHQHERRITSGRYAA